MESEYRACADKAIQRSFCRADGVHITSFTKKESVAVGGSVCVTVQQRVR
jgi:hypothetical protein